MLRNMNLGRILLCSQNNPDSYPKRFARKLPSKVKRIPYGSSPEDTATVEKPDTTIRKSRLEKLLDSASTFEDAKVENIKPREQYPAGSTLPTPDPFLSSPYTKETKLFKGGESAIEEGERRAIYDPATTYVILFPGQGTHYVGMCGDEPDLELFTTASEILGYDLLKLCREGPHEKLGETIYSQPAILVSTLSAISKLEKKDPYVIETTVGAAGFSVGEYAALVYTGAISFEDAVRIIKVRAEAMQAVSNEVPSQMATVLYGADSKLNFALEVAREWASREHNIENPVCSIASHLFPHAKVVGGHKECIDFLKMNYSDFKLRKVKILPVSGAFHTQLMKPAEECVKEMLSDIAVQQPRVPVFSNVTAKRYHSETELRRILPKQIVRPVLWEQMMHTIYHRAKDVPYPNTYEVGPGKSLLAILRACNLKAEMKSKSFTP